MYIYIYIYLTLCIYIYLYVYIYIYCRASQTGDAIRAAYSNVGVGVVHVPCWCAGAERNVMFLSHRSF